MQKCNWEFLWKDEIAAQNYLEYLRERLIVSEGKISARPRANLVCKWGEEEMWKRRERVLEGGMFFSILYDFFIRSPKQ